MQSSTRMNRSFNGEKVVREKGNSRRFLVSALGALSFAFMATTFAAPVAHNVTFTSQSGTYSGSFEVDSAALTPGTSTPGIPVTNFHATIEDATIGGKVTFDTVDYAYANTDDGVVIGLYIRAHGAAPDGTGRVLLIGYNPSGSWVVASFVTPLLSGTYSVSLASINVAINIKPGSDLNSINTCSGGTTPVVIFGSAALDVTSIEPDSLILASAAVKTVGKSGSSLCSIEDAGSVDATAFDSYGLPDGYDDLVCHFLTYDLTDLEDSSSTATLTGNLVDGTALKGEDAVNIVKDCDP